MVYVVVFFMFTFASVHMFQSIMLDALTKIHEKKRRQRDVIVTVLLASCGMFVRTAGPTVSPEGSAVTVWTKIPQMITVGKL